MPFSALIAACWVIFIVYWIATASAVKPTAEKQPRAGRAAHRLPIWAGVALLFFDWPHRLNTIVIPHDFPTGAAGLAAAALGLAAAIWARVTIADNWSGDVEFKQNHTLVVRGPYRLVRHPIYTSLLLMCLGTAIASGRAGALMSLPFFLGGFWIKLRQEERLMERHFPAEYPAYKARVKALVPFVL